MVVNWKLTQRLKIIQCGIASNSICQSTTRHHCSPTAFRVMDHMLRVFGAHFVRKSDNSLSTTFEQCNSLARPLIATNYHGYKPVSISDVELWTTGCICGLDTSLPLIGVCLQFKKCEQSHYEDNAFPADELMPLTCKGRYRWTGVNRGDIDDALGNFSLTMLDGLDSLFFDEFEVAVKAVVRTVRFDSDVDVSVFETNIRVLGYKSTDLHLSYIRFNWPDEDSVHIPLTGHRNSAVSISSGENMSKRVNLRELR
ncbi:unnamed protein product [Schistosoma mattheei]|uniref:Uncharacterized protein n=1 Tax=Schistosoma mattheei TaxID=31246 RepID=A0A183P4K8_9TREM|nr:unnamed protein product [Schistosoma mattheei]